MKAVRRFGCLFGIWEDCVCVCVCRALHTMLHHRSFPVPWIVCALRSDLARTIVKRPLRPIRPTIFPRTIVVSWKRHRFFLLFSCFPMLFLRKPVVFLL